MYKILLYIILLFIIRNSLPGQSRDELLNKGNDLRLHGQYRLALSVFETMLKMDSGNALSLSYVSILYSKVYHDEHEEEGKPVTEYYRKAEYLARKALRIDSNIADSHYALAFAVGVSNEDASHKQQIAIVMLVKTQIDKCLKINPEYAGAYHLLGRWYRRLAEFNSLEKFFIKALYGASLPEGSYQDAADAFENAVKNEPWYIYHQYELAMTYHIMGRDAAAKVWLNHAINDSYSGDDAIFVKDKCRKLLEKINKSGLM
jgi:regulator of microtubule dynamics protein 3